MARFPIGAEFARDEVPRMTATPALARTMFNPPAQSRPALS